MRHRPLLDSRIARREVMEAFRKLDPRHQLRNPVMFVVLAGAILTTVLAIQSVFAQGEEPPSFAFAISLWLWFTLLFGNLAEAVAEGRGKAQADSLRQSRRDIGAKKLAFPAYGSPFTVVPGTGLRKGDVVLVEAGDTIPMDGEVIEGAASVDESAITGESAPVARGICSPNPGSAIDSSPTKRSDRARGCSFSG